MNVELIDTMGSDLTIVNAARVSFDKESNWDDFGPLFEGQQYKNVLKEGDRKLLSYLAKHEHFTPFTHVMITMRETVPIFVARQRFKHVVGFTYNEISRRYVSDEPTFFTPSSWRLAAEDKKQGSSEEVLKNEDETWANKYLKHTYDSALMSYRELLKIGVAPEQARMVLPQSLYTSYYVTGSMSAWARAYKLRSSPDAQAEIQDLAAMWENVIGTIDELKYSWLALTN